MSATNHTIGEKFNRLVRIMDELREQCPWDQQQTIHTLRSMTIEEMYELGDGILNENWSEIKEELGDILLHILFYARIAKEEDKFTIGDVIDGIAEKMIVRHPHIYADTEVNDQEDVKRNWQKIKLAEGKRSVLAGVPVSLPAMIKAARMQEKARQVGFEWENKLQVWEKVEEEVKELKQAENEAVQHKIEEEFGDLLFSLVNYARFLNVDAESALEMTNKKFQHRFSVMESLAKDKGLQLADMTLNEMDDLWNKAKNIQPGKI
ncbi:nucleoside triphosphate pyrophosphohydrolase [Haoranjiania flava]|uniref:Nucleoside triphosphate pyrophosphohydrolase n=1 Tax=Haoranjiania flava TaxID=1856322 RepID=A0AAE3LKX0_9BACT|nr:nucleoside triphosphate pyrophosphohydrolase [Haoranjiania flava]MCU7695397.1 nucleoside triphosphate pyrophosphohydrolase [Haoranjiania flava]